VSFFALGIQFIARAGHSLLRSLTLPARRKSWKLKAKGQFITYD